MERFKTVTLFTLKVWVTMGVIIMYSVLRGLIHFYAKTEVTGVPLVFRRLHSLRTGLVLLFILIRGRRTRQGLSGMFLSKI